MAALPQMPPLPPGGAPQSPGAPPPSGPPPAGPGAAAGPPSMNNQLMTLIMGIIMGFGLPHGVQTIEKLKKLMDPMAAMPGKSSPASGLKKDAGQAQGMAMNPLLAAMLAKQQGGGMSGGGMG